MKKSVDLRKIMNLPATSIRYYFKKHYKSQKQGSYEPKILTKKEKGVKAEAEASAAAEASAEAEAEAGVAKDQQKIKKEMPSYPAKVAAFKIKREMPSHPAE